MVALLAVLKLFIINISIYNKYIQYIDTSFIKDNYKELHKILKTIQVFREKSDSLELDNFFVFFFKQFPGMRPDDVEVYNSIFERMSQLRSDEAGIVGYLNEIKTKEIAVKVAAKAIEVSEGRAKFDDVRALTEQVDRKIEENGEQLFVSDSLETIYRENFQTPGYRWRLNTLNKMLGSLRKGNFGFVAARPEVGKTTFITDQVSFMAPQKDAPVLHVNNEQAGSEVKSRYYQSAFGITTAELYRNRAKYEAMFKEQYGGKILLYDNANAGRKDLYNLCKTYNPGLIIIDQIDKLKGFEGDRHDLLLKQIYQFARELAKEFGPVIGVCQAGGTAEGKKWINMNDIDSSHTAKQGEADWILGIGAVADEQFQNERYFHVMKNKLMGDEDTLPALRHGKCPVRILPEIGRYQDTLKL